MQTEFKQPVVKAVYAFKAKKTFKLTPADRMTALVEMSNAIVRAYGKPVPLVEFQNINGSHSGNSYYDPQANRIVIQGKLSIITLLHEVAHCLFGASQEKAWDWSVGLFAKVYPRQFASLTQDNETGMYMGNANFRTPNARITPCVA